MKLFATTATRGAALNAHLLARGFMPLIDPWAGVIQLYRFRSSVQLTDRESEEVRRERAVIGAYLRGLAT